LQSGNNPQDQKQEKSIQQYGSRGTATGNPAELNAIRPPGFRFVVPVLVVESFMPGSSAHQRWKHNQWRNVSGLKIITAVVMFSVPELAHHPSGMPQLVI